MTEPCRSCPEKSKDFGGCRCQAFILTGDASATDPVCGKSPKHHLIEAARRQAQQPAKPLSTLTLRNKKNSRLIACS